MIKLIPKMFLDWKFTNKYKQNATNCHIQNRLLTPYIVRVARPNRSTHLVAVAAVAVVAAAVTVAGCLGLAATKRKKPRM